MEEKMSQRPEHETEEESAIDSPSWGHLRNPFLASRPASERARILDLAGRTAKQLQAWATVYPSMRQARIRPLCLSVAAAAPFCDVPALLSTARMSLWVFALDDLYDEAAFPAPTLRRMAERFQGLAAGLNTHQEAEDEMERALVAIRHDLSSYPLFPALQTTWVEALSGTIREMQREADWREQYRLQGAAMLPSYEAYLDCGRYSIGGPPHVWSALITIGDQTTPTHLGTLAKMERLASTGIRLANDLQSHQKELVEGKINSLVILSHKFAQLGHTPDEVFRLAQAAVRSHIARLLDELAQYQLKAETETGHPETAVVNIARFVCDFYESHDFHTFDGDGR